VNPVRARTAETFSDPVQYPSRRGHRLRRRNPMHASAANRELVPRTSTRQLIAETRLSLPGANPRMVERHGNIDAEVNYSKL
jgi:hypothetical protein